MPVHSFQCVDHLAMQLLTSVGPLFAWTWQRYLLNNLPTEVLQKMTIVFLITCEHIIYIYNVCTSMCCNEEFPHTINKPLPGTCLESHDYRQAFPWHPSQSTRKQSRGRPASSELLSKHHETDRLHRHRQAFCQHPQLLRAPGDILQCTKRKTSFLWNLKSHETDNMKKLIFLWGP